MATFCISTLIMSHYIAYHSVHVMGRDYTPATEFSFYTRKPEGLVFAAVGATAWVIVGKRVSGHMQYLLAGAYEPRDVADEAGVWVIKGRGTPLDPRLDVTNLPWFAILKREQNNFSFGFNRIQDQDVIGALTRLIPTSGHDQTVTSEPRVITDSTAAPSDLTNSNLDPDGTRIDLFRCLSVRDPWIRLLGLGVKPFELRKRVTHYRGPVLLCSSAAPSRTDDARAAFTRYKRILATHPNPLGHALFVADLVNSWLAVRDAPTTRGACCAPSEGEWVWEFRNVRPLPEPQPVSGFLGLFYPTRALALYVKHARLLG
jgi:hypothetical protein